MNRPADPIRIVVIGGGVSGLAAAHRLIERRGEENLPLEVVVLEAGDTPGGSIRTTRRDGFLLEAGPDSFITEKPWGLALCRRLGLSDSIIRTNDQHRLTFIIRRGRMYALPDGFLMLAPTKMWPFVFSGLFSLRGKMRMALDLLLPRGNLDDDESLASFVTRRLGREALERAAQPLVSGIYTADPVNLSLQATMPRFLEMERKYRSLIRAMRVAGKMRAKAGRTEAGARYSMFVTLADGMDTLVNAIVARIGADAVRTGHQVTRLSRNDHGRPWSVHVADREPISADGVILAAPAYSLAQMTADLAADLSAMFGCIRYASSATLNLAYRREQIGHPLNGFGFVVPHIERRTIIASTFSHVKFAGRAPEGMALLRAFIGGALNEDIYALDDDELRRTATAELTDLLSIRGEPAFTVLNRWPQSMPQYAVGHLDHVARITDRLSRLPPVGVAGNAFGGVGIPDCVRSGEGAADTVLNALGHSVPTT
ncbi:MAG TPA: protoporphyrinogen oxidase [Phycisphaerae bacterium]|nr:protoporphyrinogen oxidase [Phycisphaerae bacterium]